jgi:AcrR family transcriptional regulator
VSAVELFTTQGYDATTVEQIASAAGVSPRTFFYHFATKEEILFDGYEARLHEAVRRFRIGAGASLAGALTDAASAVAAGINEQPAVFVTRARLYSKVPALRATMLRINEVWIDDMSAEVATRLGLDPRTDLRPRLAATLINGANRAAIEAWIACGGDQDVAELIAEAVALVRPAIEWIERNVEQEHADHAE